MHIQCDYKSVVSYCGWLTDNLKIFSKYAETKKVGMQFKFIAVAPCGTWTEQITRDHKPAKINLIEMHRLKLKVWTIQKNIKSKKRLTEIIQSTKEDTRVKTVGFWYWLHMPMGP